MKIAQRDETGEMYQKNLSLLPENIQGSLSKISEDELWNKVEVVYRDGNQPVCRYRRDGVCFHITGEHPVQEAEAWRESLSQRDASTVFLYGTGFGYALFDLFEHKMPHTLLIVFEQDVFLFKAMLYYFDLSPMIFSRKVIFFVGNPSDFEEYFQFIFGSVIYYSCTCPAVACTLPAARNFKKQYAELHRYVFERLAAQTFSLGNSHHDTMLGLRNLFANTNYILQNPYLTCLKDRYKNVPAFIVANGPSLDADLDALKKIQGRGLIISVESAIVPLMKNGIKPDILAIVERTEYTYRYHFKNREYPPDIALLSLALVDPNVYPSFPGEMIPLFRKGEAMNMWFSRFLAEESALSAGSNVSHLALELAVYLGADPIVFVGQDFAYGPDGVTHSRDAVYRQNESQREYKMIHAIPTVYVEGNNGEMIPSNELWTAFRKGLEEKIAGYPQRRCFNATRGGARIRGTERKTLEDAIRDYCTGPIPCRVNERIAQERTKIHQEERSALLKAFIADVEQAAVMYRRLTREMNCGKLECLKMMRLSAADDDEIDRNMLEQNYQKHISAFTRYLLEEHSGTYFQQIICIYFYFINHLGMLDTKEKRTEAFHLQSLFYHDLGVVSQSLSVVLAEAAESLKALLDERKTEGKNV